jgi:hypothetical protein
MKARRPFRPRCTEVQGVHIGEESLRRLAVDGMGTSVEIIDSHVEDRQR